MELSRELTVSGVPLRLSGNVSWLHDFECDPKMLSTRLQVPGGSSWTIESDRRSADALRAGLSIEMAVGNRKTLRVYGDQQLQSGGNLIRGGVTFTIGF